jgi:hypothetical protein
MHGGGRIAAVVISRHCEQETTMKKLYLCLTLCGLFLLQGCFDSSKNTTKQNTDGTKSSVQMQEGKAEENK